MSEVFVIPPVDRRRWQWVVVFRDRGLTYLALAPASDSFALPSETIASMSSESAVCPAIESELDALDATSREFFTTGNARTILIEGSDDDHVIARRIENDAIFGDRTEITRTFAADTRTTSLLYAVERHLSEPELRLWIERMRAAEPEPKSFDELRASVDAARRDAWQQGSRMAGGELIVKARQTLVATDAQENAVDWLNAAIALGWQATNLTALLQIEGIDAETLTELMNEGRTALRQAAKIAIQLDRRQFLGLYERLATAHFFDLGSSRAHSLEVAELAYQYLLDEALRLEAFSARLVQLKASALIARSFFAGEQLLDHALTLLFTFLRGDAAASIECFRFLAANGAILFECGRRGAPSLYHEALAFFDFAATYLSNTSLSIPSDLGGFSDELRQLFELSLEFEMGQRTVQLALLGLDSIDGSLHDTTRQVGSLLFLRPLRSSRRFPVPNRFDPSLPHLLAYSQEPERISLEAALHRTLYDRLSTFRIDGPSDLLGMTFMNPMASVGRTLNETTEQEWRRHVEISIEGSSIILVLLWPSAGVLWEAETILQRCPHKCVLLMLPADYFPDAAEQWSAARSLLGEKDLDVPQYCASGGFFLYGSDGRLVNEMEFDAIWTAALSKEFVAHMNASIG